MGMFDSITVHNLGDTIFQTKSLDCTLSDYHIAADGRFSRKLVDNEFSILKPSVCCESFSDTVFFYGHENHKWVEYRATIKEGKCVRIDKQQDDHSWKKRFQY